MFAGLNFNIRNHQEAKSGYSDLSNSVCGMWAGLDRVGGSKIEPSSSLVRLYTERPASKATSIGKNSQPDSPTVSSSSSRRCLFAKNYSSDSMVLKPRITCSLPKVRRSPCATT
jgi:hypothetical protein